MLMNELVEIFKATHPDGPPMLVYRGGMWAGSMYQEQWQALQNQSLFLEDKRLCTGCVEYPLDVDVSGFESPQHTLGSNGKTSAINTTQAPYNLP